MAINILVEATPLKNGIPTTVRMSDRATSKAGVAVDLSTWLPVITSAPSPSFSLSDGSGTQAPASTSYGNLSATISDATGNADWNTYWWQSAPFTLWVGDSERPFSEYKQLFTGTMSGHNHDRSTITWGLLTRAGRTNNEFLSARYAGTDGAEGPSDMRGTFKPRAHGAVFNVTPVKINPALLVYQVHGYGAVSSIPALYELGIAYEPAKANYASYDGLAAADLKPGEWATCLAKGMFRLGGITAGNILADVVGGTIDGQTPRTAGDIIVQLLKEAGVSSERIGDMSALNMEWSIYQTGSTSIMSVIEQAALDAGGYVFLDRNGKWQCGRWAGSKNPAQAPGELKDDRSAEPLVNVIREIDAPNPVRRVSIGYAKNYTVLSANDVSPALLDLEGKVAAQDEALKEVQALADSASADAEFARNEVEAMLKDGVLDRSDKRRVVDMLERERVSYKQLQGIYTAFNVSSFWTAYQTAFTALDSYLTGLSPSIYDNSANTPADRTTYLTKLNAFELAKTNLLNAISNSARKTSDWSSVANDNGKKAADYADVTANNTSKDTNAVGGVPAQTIKTDIATNKTNYIQVSADFKAFSDQANATMKQTQTDIAQVRDVAVPAVSKKADDIRAEALTAVDGVTRRVDSLEQSGFDDTALNAKIDDVRTVAAKDTKAVADRTTTLETAVTAPTTGALSRLTNLETTVTTGEFALTKRTQTLEAQMTGAQGSNLNTRLSTVETATTDGRFAQAQRVSNLEARSNSSANLLSNTEWTTGTDGWAFASESGSGGARNGITGSNWWPVNTNCLVIGQGNNSTSRAGYWYQTISGIEADAYYQFSMYSASHRCNTTLYIDWLGTNGGGVGSASVDVPEGNPGNGLLNSFYHYCVNTKAPAGAAYMRVYMIKQGTGSGWDNSYAWFLKPQVVRIDPSVTKVVPYTAGNNTAEQGALNARIQTVETATTDGRFAAASRMSNLEASASASSGSAVFNDNFAVWLDGQGLPSRWGYWAAQGNFRVERLSPGRGGGLYCVRTYNDVAGVDSGFVQTIYTAGPGKWVAEVTIDMPNGSLQGAGVTLHGIWNIDFCADPDTNGRVGDSNPGDVRSWSRMFDIDARDQINVHAMHGWTGFNRTIMPKAITWHCLRLRPATDGEIKAGKADAALNNPGGIVARLSTVETVTTNGTFASASRATTLEAQVNGDAGSNLLSRANSTAQVYANNALGSANSRMDVMVSEYNGIGAKVERQAGTIADINGRTRAYVSSTAVAGNNRAQIAIYADSNGGAGVDIVGDTTFKGKLEVGTGQSGARTEITNNGMRVYDSNNVLRVVLGLF